MPIIMRAEWVMNFRPIYTYGLGDTENAKLRHLASERSVH